MQMKGHNTVYGTNVATYFSISRIRQLQLKNLTPQQISHRQEYQRSMQRMQMLGSAK